MSVSPAYKPAMSLKAFLEWAENETGRYEFLKGKIVAMSGASLNHNRIAFDFAFALQARLRGTPCEALSTSQAVKPEHQEAYFLPDVVVTCEEIRMGEGESILNPILLGEVLSLSTEKHDRGRKLQAYREIESLQEYVLVSQEMPVVECFRRRGEAWEHHLIVGLEAVLRLESVGCEIPLAEIYERVQFPEEDEVSAE